MNEYAVIGNNQLHEIIISNRIFGQRTKNNPLGMYALEFSYSTIDVFDHLIQQPGVVIPIIESEIEFPIQ